MLTESFNEQLANSYSLEQVSDILHSTYNKVMNFNLYTCSNFIELQRQFELAKRVIRKIIANDNHGMELSEITNFSFDVIVLSLRRRYPHGFPKEMLLDILNGLQYKSKKHSRADIPTEYFGLIEINESYHFINFNESKRRNDMIDHYKDVFDNIHHDLSSDTIERLKHENMDLYSYLMGYQ